MAADWTPAAVPVRDAATVMLLRDVAGRGLEVFMLRRNLNSDFVGGAYVFPGGGVDSADRAEDLEPFCEGLTDVEASRILGVERGGLAFWVAAVRECFEEAGVLLARDGDREVVSFADPGRAARFAGHRAAMNGGTLSLVDLCRIEDLVLDVGAMHYFAHWITPLGAPRRYDTRFFIAAAPAEQVPLHDNREVIANLWIAPREALNRNATGDYELIMPTFKNLEVLTRFETGSEVLDVARSMSEIPAILPRIGRGPDGVRILLPGDKGYEAAAQSRERRSRAESDIRASAAVAPQPPGTGELAPGAVTVLSPRIRRIIAPNPSMMTGPGTGSYLVAEPGGDVAVIDPGPADDVHLDRLVEAGAGRIRWVLVTHTHEDHSPGVAGLVARTGATSVGFGPRDDFVPDVRAGEGWRLSLGGATLRALHTPGHASNHLCWLLEEEATLFSGDHIMNGSTVVIAPPDGDMAAYLDQLERVRHLGLAAIAPGHGGLIVDPEAKIDEYVTHRREREEQVLGALRPGTTAGELVAVLYAEVPEDLHPVARFSVWAHLRKLAAEGRASSEDPDDIDARWSPT